MKSIKNKSIPCNFIVTLEQKLWLSKKGKQSKFIRDYLAQHKKIAIVPELTKTGRAMVQLHLYSNEIIKIQKHGWNMSLTLRSIIQAAMNEEQERTSQP